MKTRFLVAATLVTCAAAAGAQSLKPGLWEITNKMQSASGEMERGMAQAQQQMANLSPEERKMVEEMMARKGMKMGTAGGGGMTIKMCMTKEMVERNEMPSQQRGDCKTTQQSRSGNTMKMAFACTNPPSSGEGQFTYASPEAYNMKMAVSTTVQGKPETMNMEGAGKWLGADCGDIKPIAPRK